MHAIILPPLVIAAAFMATLLVLSLLLPIMGRRVQSRPCTPLAPSAW